MYVGNAKRLNDVEITMPNNEIIMLRYRDPTPDEIRKYHSESLQRKGNRVVIRYAETHEKYGLKILAGIREGDFGIIGPDKKPVCVSSDPDSDFFRQDWKNLFAENALSAVIALGAHVFGGTEAGAADEVDGSDADRD